MNILGIESSCDETAIAVVKDGRKVLVNTIASSLKQHQDFGGVVPEIAAREHVKVIIPLVKKSLEDANLVWNDVDAIAVTVGPGLVGSLIIGYSTAHVLAEVFQKPLIAVNHIAGHIYSNWLYPVDMQEIPSQPELPCLVLTVSGGHNELVLLNDDHDFTVLGETIDDAAGEAFDKVSRILGLGFPGGPAISKKAEQGNPDAFDFPRALLKGKEHRYDFSFSGLKTAVLYKVKEFEELSEQDVCDIAASFQEAVCDVMVKKLMRAFDDNPHVKEIHLAGGVSANQRLRELLVSELQKRNLTIACRHPLNIRYCTDNAAMIAGAAYFMKDAGVFKVNPGLGLESSM